MPTQPVNAACAYRLSTFTTDPWWTMHQSPWTHGGLNKGTVCVVCTVLWCTGPVSADKFDSLFGQQCPLKMFSALAPKYHLQLIVCQILWSKQGDGEAAGLYARPAWTNIADQLDQWGSEHLVSYLGFVLHNKDGQDYFKFKFKVLSLFKKASFFSEKLTTLDWRRLEVEWSDKNSIDHNELPIAQSVRVWTRNEMRR